MSRAQLKFGDISLGLAHEWVCAFGRRGGTAVMLQQTIEDSKLMQHVVFLWNQEVTRYLEERAEAPVYNVRMVNALFSLGYTEEQITAFELPPETPPGFLTFFDPGWCLLQLRGFCKTKGNIFCSQDWYDREDFAHVTKGPKYRQIRLEAVEGSFNKNFDDQMLRILPVDEEIPLVRVVAMGMVIHFLRSGQRLFERYRVRCADKDSDGRRVGVGNFDSDGFVVRDYWDDSRGDHLGLASSVPPRES